MAPSTSQQSPRRIIASVSDKGGLGFLKRFTDTGGWQVISTGGTLKQLKELDVPCTDVEEMTGMPEMMGGRVKTLHPIIHGSVLARPSTNDMDQLRMYVNGLGLPVADVVPIELVVVNFYPFRATVELFKEDKVSDADVVEQIDIGGPALVRAAAKACNADGGPLVVVDPRDYEWVADALLSGTIPPELRRQLMYKAYAATADYDMAIAAWTITRLGGSAH